MRNPHPFNCDVCGQGKQPSNNWMLGIVKDVEIYSLRLQDDETKTNFSAHVLGAVVVSSWDDKLAEAEGISHLCGIECAVKWSTKKFDELHVIVAAPATKTHRGNLGVNDPRYGD